MKFVFMEFIDQESFLFLKLGKYAELLTQFLAIVVYVLLRVE